MRAASGIMLMLGAVVLAITALWHVYWILGGTAGLIRAVPERNGKPMFVPGKAATGVVSGAIAAIAALYAMTAAGLTPPPLTPGILAVLLGLTGVVFIARAVGDFKHVGFFNLGGKTPFAVADRRVYSPLCLFLGVVGLHAAGLQLM